MFFKLFLLFAAIPILEVYILVRLGGAIGWKPTLGICIVTALAGSLLAKHQGLNAWRRVQADLAQGILPGDALLDGLLILAGGLLLITPGLITDTVGLLLVIPFTRRALKAWIKWKLSRKLRTGVAVRYTVREMPDDEESA
ncbi:MAG: FxsA family protein [Planctomycetes bacterium]|nr:FxsA family protein [Planctomycetota bacterium]MBM4087195.1 FxsA family protein [Planctomycetota bacterium]